MTGVLLIVIPGEIAIQTGLPGRFHVFATQPTSEVMLDFPIVLAPSLVVPVFLLLNILGVYAARTQSGERHIISGPGTVRSAAASSSASMTWSANSPSLRRRDGR
jgi:hypothetical protein